MIDCCTCKHWDCFTWNAHSLSKTPSGGLERASLPPEEIATCALGYSPIDNGKTVSSVMDKCDAYDRI